MRARLNGVPGLVQELADLAYAPVDCLGPDAEQGGDGHLGQGEVLVEGGGAALRPIEGGEQIARYAADLASRAPSLTILERTVNGPPGLVARQDGVTVMVFAFEVAGDRITHIWAVRNR